MATDVIMPQMGESIQEGTLVKWLKKPGDTVARDEPLFEISTDKVDAEIPSPAAGVLSEIKVNEGETVAIKTVVAVIESDAKAARAGAAAQVPPATSREPASPAAARARAPAEAPPVPASAAERSGSQASAGVRPEPGSAGGGSIDGRGGGTFEERIHTRSSPVVRKIAAEHGIEIAALQGTGISGRVTKRDILDFIAKGGPPTKAAPAGEAPRTVPAFVSGERLERQPMTTMRRKIAEHMILSRRTSAHVTTVFEVDMSQIASIRAAHKQAFQDRHGVNLTYMPFIMKATVDALIAFPSLNASIDGNDVLLKKDINLGVAVALDWGLIVPVVKNAQDLSLSGLAKSVGDLANRARSKQLKPEEVQGGTFTITNPGIFGSLFGTPIINQPQVAILGVGTIEKRPVVIADAIAIRTMAYLAVSFDHRLIDGAVADQFMAKLKKDLEEFDASAI